MPALAASQQHAVCCVKLQLGSVQKVTKVIQNENCGFLSPQERAEIIAFLDAVMATRPMRYARKVRLLARPQDWHIG
jgi:hypothetical protein